MLYPDVLKEEITRFNGALGRIPTYAVPNTFGLAALNLSYVRGQFSSRFGHTPLYNQSDGGVTSMFNWYFVQSGTGLSLIAYYAPAVGVRGLNQIGPQYTTLMPQTGAAGASMASVGQLLFAAFYDSTGRSSTFSGQVYGWNVGADNLFPAPIQNAPTVTETAAGVCTAGTRRIGYQFITRNGFVGKLCPVDSNANFTPVSFTSTGNHNLHISIPGPFPSYLTGSSARLQIVMTTTYNLNRYFVVPGSAISQPFGNPAIINVSITDDDLAATGQDVTTATNILSSSVGGFPPFFPTFVGTYSSRMGYITTDTFGFPVIYFSDENAFQSLTAGFHGVYFESQVIPIAFTSLRGVCYVFAQHATYSTEDNGGFPVTWSPAQKVDGSIGVLGPDCIFTNPAQGYVFVASDRGLYLFQGGLYPPLPLSYYQAADWNRINWNLPTVVKVVDDQLNKRVMVKAPLMDTVIGASNTNPITITTVGNPNLYITNLSVQITGVQGNTAANGTWVITSTGPNTFTIPTAGNGTYTSGGTVEPQTASHIMTWDYTDGDQPDTVKYSLNSFSAYKPGSFCIMSNQSNQLNEVWYGCAVNGFFIRQNDGSELFPNRDSDESGNPVPISWLWESSLVPNESMVQSFTRTIHEFHGMHLRGVGSGPLSIAAFSPDHVKTVTPLASPITLSLKPGLEYLIRWSMRGEKQSVQLSGNTIDSSFSAAMLRMYYTPSFTIR